MFPVSSKEQQQAIKAGSPDRVFEGACRLPLLASLYG
jgi:hypothetical protein